MGPGKTGLHDQLRKIAEELPERVPSTPGVYGVGKYDETMYGDDAAAAIYDALRDKHGPKDAVHVATASSVRCDYFVTQETTGGLLVDVNRLRLPMKAINADQMSALLLSHMGQGRSENPVPPT